MRSTVLYLSLFTISFFSLAGPMACSSGGGDKLPGLNCTDGIDDDNDGLSDCQDEDCARDMACVLPVWSGFACPAAGVEAMHDGIMQIAIAQWPGGCLPEPSEYKLSVALNGVNILEGNMPLTIDDGVYEVDF